MPKFPGINHRQAIRAFEKAGFRVIRESVHIIMSNGATTLIIPRHNPVNQYVMAGLIKDAGLTMQQFKELLK
ncbi:MAG: type II toxin-antitoxin system HicA family toxin [Chlorobia bacterium]|nr:type II toxin-antitoxin system HicA family toxin [Fimbriimonadaceae bacterium]